MKTLQDAGVEPDVWALEGFDDPHDCERAVEMARRDGRADVTCIVSGRRTATEQIERRLTTAASVSGFIGFAVGPATYGDAVADYVSHRTTRDEAAARIALRYRQWAAVFERAHRAAASAA